MGNLAYIGNGHILTTSLVIADGAGMNHKSVIQLIRQNIKDFEEFGLVAFEMRPRLEGKHGGGNVKFALLNEHQATLLMTHMRNSPVVREFKKRLIKAFFELVDNKPTAPAIPQTFAEAMRLAADQAEAVLMLEAKNEVLEVKSIALDRIGSSEGSLCVSNVAKDLGIRQKALFDWLRENKWIYRRTGYSVWLAYQDKIQRGLLEHKVTTISRGDGSEKVTEQVRVTARGIAWLAENMAVA